VRPRYSSRAASFSTKGVAFHAKQDYCFSSKALSDSPTAADACTSVVDFVLAFAPELVEALAHGL
jgi:hypothetical protein